MKLILAQHVEPLLGVHIRLDLIALTAEHEPHIITDIGIIINDEDTDGAHHSPGIQRQRSYGPPQALQLTS
jgi:hypothetical protein